MESYVLDGFPAECSSIHLALFQSVSNAADLRRRLVEVATAQGPEAEVERDRLDYAFIDAHLVSSKWEPGLMVVSDVSR
jgi:EKC/KEOPS complex subunit CGI121/TPRKB